MRTVLSFCLALLTVTIVGRAQTSAQWNEADLTSTTEWASALTSAQPVIQAGSSADKTIVVDEITWFPVVLPNGQTRTDVFVNESSVHCTGDCAAFDLLSTRELFDEIALAAIDRGLSEGWMECTTNCTGSNVNARIWTAACVERTGSGCSTHFQSCDMTTRAWRDYEVCCYGNQGGPTIMLVAFGSEAQDCTGSNCESTVPVNQTGGTID